MLGNSDEKRVFLAAGLALSILGSGCLDAALAQGVPSLASTTETTVPFVGCAGDGQTFAVAAKRGRPKSVRMTPNQASSLAYYSFGSIGVLAPRGWQCFALYGSNGESLLVAPEVSHSLMLPTSISGAGIEVVRRDSGAWGRIDVARTIARVFPARLKFVKQIIAEGIVPAASFPIGPFAADRLDRMGPDLVEYRTPPHAQGLGTSYSQLRPGSEPVSGVAIIRGDDANDPDLWYSAVRLPPNLSSLEPLIIRQFEKDNPPGPYEQRRALSGARTPFAAAVGFYSALSKGDGATAARFVIPQKRLTGPLSASALSSFYSRMQVPLQIENATAESSGSVLVHYNYVYPGGHRCNGTAEVRTVETDSGYLVTGIQALNGC